MTGLIFATQPERAGAADLIFRSADPVAAAAKSVALDESPTIVGGNSSVELALLRDELAAAIAARDEAAASLAAAQAQLERSAAEASS